MYQSPSNLLERYLNKRGISPQKFSEISGMPLTEVHGILNGNIPVTRLRANHLAAALDTSVSIWMEPHARSRDKKRKVSH